MDVCSVWPLLGDFHAAVASRVADHRSLFPIIWVHVLGCESSQVMLRSVLCVLSRV